MAIKQQQPSALGVGAVVDPTRNVLDLVDKAIERQDDLRDQSAAFTKCQYDCMKEIINLRDDHSKAMRAAESRRVDEQAQLRADYAKELSVAEKQRIDAIRAVDVNAVSVAAERSTQQATVLANQVAQSAEALRTLVAATATTVATAQQQLGSALSERITKVEQAQYTGAGKGLGVGMVGAIAVGAVVIITGVIAVVAFLGNHTGATPALAVPPGYILTPAPK